MGAMEGARVLPWADWTEWAELKDMLENGETDMACERVALYQMRRKNAVPLTVLTTVALVKLLEDPAKDSYSQRLALSMALTRFVNGTTDRLQPRGEGASARSVYGLAVELQLPLILVEIRHQASHNVLPRLSSLTSGAKQALAWLEKHYWVPQMAKVEHCLQNSLSAIRQVLSRNSDDETSEVPIVMPQENGAPEKRMLDCGGSSVLRTLKKVIAKLEAREKEKTRSSVLEATQESRWTECSDENIWRVLPLGLAPGQQEVPRLRYAPNSKKRRRNSDESTSEFNEPRRGTADHTTAVRDTTSVPDHPAVTNNAISPALKHARVLTVEEESYVRKKMAELRQYAKPSVQHKAAAT